MNFIIADDSVFFRNYFKNQITNLGHTVVAEVGSGKALIDRIKKEEVDFVLTDIAMQPMSGLDASIEIVKKFPSIKIICSTLQNINSWISEMKLIGIKGYIYKNSGQESLIMAINSSMNNDFYIDTPVVKNIVDDLKKILTINNDNTNTNLEEIKTEIQSVIFNSPRLKKIDGYAPNERELVLLKATAEGKPVKQIADLLEISERNISKIKEKMREKAGVSTNVELLSISHKMGWIV